MNSKKMLTFGVITAGSFFILLLTSVLLVSGDEFYLIGKLISALFVAYMAFRIFKMAIGTKKNAFLTNKQGFSGIFLFAVLGVFVVYLAQGLRHDIVSKLFSLLGFGIIIIVLCFSILAFGMWIKERFFAS
jgi:hypothetical protein